MNKKLIVIGIQEENIALLQRQLEAVFLGEVNIHPITLKDLHFKSIASNDVILLTGESILEIVKPFLHESNTCIVANRTVNIVNMKELLYLKGNSNILVVNDNDYDTVQTTEAIKSFLPQQNYISYLTNQPIPSEIDLVVTPGESHLIPRGLPRVIDIGTRVISIETLQELITIFNLSTDQQTLTQLYIKSMVILSEEKTFPKKTSLADMNLNRRFDGLHTTSASLQSTIRIAKKLAKTDHTVHIEGEVGTGKQMFAEMIHNHSKLSDHPIYMYNCSDKDLEVIQKELFSEKTGFIHSIAIGTIVIRNIDSLPYSLQGELLKAIEQQPTRNIRLITSSAISLENLLHKRTLRTEIYMHLSPYTLRLINLSERREDIHQLISDFKGQLNRVNMHFSAEVMEAFYQYSWPGNVRELFNVVSYCVCLNTHTIELESLPTFFQGNLENTTVQTENERIIEQIEEHGFLNESMEILAVLNEGKEKNQSYGRGMMKSRLLEKNCVLTDQQLRLRLDVLRTLDLINVRRGRAGTTITTKGETFLHTVQTAEMVNR